MAVALARGDTRAAAVGERWRGARTPALLGDGLGRLADACALMREVAEVRTAVLGAEHAETRNSARALAEWEAQLKS